MFAEQRMDDFLAGLAGNIGLCCTHHWPPTARFEMKCRSLEPLCDEDVSSWLFIRFSLKVCRTVIEDFISSK